MILLFVTGLIIIFLLGFVDKSISKPIENTADITYSISDIPEDLKAVAPLTTRQQDIICAISKGLVEVDIDGNIVPALAESVEVRENGIEYEFKIRKNIYWSDGTKITPKDIVMFFREAITEEKEENIKGLLNVFGAKEYRSSNESFNTQVGISATDSSIIFRLNAEDDDFIKELSKPQYRVRKNVLLWEKIKMNYLNIPYSGDYSITDIEGNQIVLKRNKKSDINLAQSIHIVKGYTEDLALASFEIGDTDIVIDPPRSQLKRLQAEKRLITFPSQKTTYLVFNNESDLISISGRREIYTEINEALRCYQDKNKESINLAEGSYFRDEAEDLSKLQARKVSSTNNGNEEEWQIPNEITLVAEESSQNKELVQYLSNWFNENTELFLNYSLLSKEEFKKIKNKTYYDLALVNVIATSQNKEEFYKDMDSYLPDNLSGKDISGMSKEESEVVFSQFEDTMFNTYSILPLIFYNENIAINAEIRNVSLDGNGNILFNNIKK